MCDKEINQLEYVSMVQRLKVMLKQGIISVSIADGFSHFSQAKSNELAEFETASQGFLFVEQVYETPVEWKVLNSERGELYAKPKHKSQ